MATPSKIDIHTLASDKDKCLYLVELCKGMLQVENKLARIGRNKKHKYFRTWERDRITYLELIEEAVPDLEVHFKKPETAAAETKATLDRIIEKSRKSSKIVTINTKEELRKMQEATETIKQGDPVPDHLLDTPGLIAYSDENGVKRWGLDPKNKFHPVPLRRFDSLRREKAPE